MSAPANGIVRAVLSVAGSSWRESEQRLRGGRVIGLLERWLVLGLAVVGEPTAAALVVSAKSLLRFPELSRTVREEEGDDTPAARADWVTEYFLLGSLASWTIALGVAVLY